MSKRRLLLVGVMLAAGSALVAIKPDAPLRAAWREWTVVSMRGFDSEPIPGASFRFIGDEVGLDDGVNSMRFRLAWVGEGFHVRDLLISTDVGLVDEASTLAELFEVGEFVRAEPGWGEITLSRGGMVAVARR